MEEDTKAEHPHSSSSDADDQPGENQDYLSSMMTAPDPRRRSTVTLQRSVVSAPGQSKRPSIGSKNSPPTSQPHPETQKSRHPIFASSAPTEGSPRRDASGAPSLVASVRAQLLHGSASTRSSPVRRPSAMQWTPANGAEDGSSVPFFSKPTEEATQPTHLSASRPSPQPIPQPEALESEVVMVLPSCPPPSKAASRFEGAAHRASYMDDYRRHASLMDNVETKGLTRVQQARLRITMNMEERRRHAKGEMQRTQERTAQAQTKRVLEDGLRKTHVSATWLTVLMAFLAAEKWHQRQREARAFETLQFRLAARILVRVKMFRQRQALEKYTNAKRYTPPDMQLLRNDKILRHFPEEILAKLSSTLVLQFLFKGDILIYQGSIGTTCYVIESGECTVLVDKQLILTPTKEKMMLKKGAVIGTPGMVSREARMATIRAATDVLVWAATSAGFEEHADSSDPRVRAAFEATDDIHRSNIVNLNRKTLNPDGLRKFGVFSAVDKDILTAVHESFAPELFRPGEVLVPKNQRGTAAWLVLRGEVSITMRIPASTHYSHALFHALRLSMTIQRVRRKTRDSIYSAIDRQLRPKFNGSEAAPQSCEFTFDVDSMSLIGIACLLFGSPYGITATAKSQVDCIIIQREPFMRAMLTDGFALLDARNSVTCDSLDFLPFWYCVCGHPCSDSIHLVNSRLRMRGTCFSSGTTRSGNFISGLPNPTRDDVANVVGSENLAVTASNPDDGFIVFRGAFASEQREPECGKQAQPSSGARTATFPYLWPSLTSFFFGGFHGVSKLSSLDGFVRKVRRRDFHKAVSSDLDEVSRDFFTAAIREVAAIERGGTVPEIAVFNNSTVKKVLIPGPAGTPSTSAIPVAAPGHGKKHIAVQPPAPAPTGASSSSSAAGGHQVSMVEMAVGDTGSAVRKTSSLARKVSFSTSKEGAAAPTEETTAAFDEDSGSATFNGTVNGMRRNNSEVKDELLLHGGDSGTDIDDSKPPPRQPFEMGVPQWTPRRRHVYAQERPGRRGASPEANVPKAGNSVFSYAELADLMRDHIPDTNPYHTTNMARAQRESKKTHHRPNYERKTVNALGYQAARPDPRPMEVAIASSQQDPRGGSTSKSPLGPSPPPVHDYAPEGSLTQELRDLGIGSRPSVPGPHVTAADFGLDESVPVPTVADIVLAQDYKPNGELTALLASQAARQRDSRQQPPGGRRGRLRQPFAITCPDAVRQPSLAGAFAADIKEAQVKKAQKKERQVPIRAPPGVSPTAVHPLSTRIRGSGIVTTANGHASSARAISPPSSTKSPLAATVPGPVFGGSRQIGTGV